MERRHFQFIAISLAIVLAGQLLQSRLFPKPKDAAPPPAAAADGGESGEAADPAGEPAPDTAAVRSEVAADPAAPAADEAPAEAAPRLRRSLGSLDPAHPARMLVTLTSRGAAVERIELADERFHDQDDWSGYLGHLAVARVTEGAGGCRVGVVGAGTPAAKAGILAGDVITAVAGTPTPDPAALRTVLAGTRPGKRVAIELRRAGDTLAVETDLERRPLEVVRPEYRALPVADADGDPHDPLSFRLSLETRDGAKRGDATAEIRGQELADVDWQLESDADGGVRFARRLPGGLTVTKTYRLAEAGDGYRLELEIGCRATDTATRLSYAIDGPTGLPTEGWWYAQRVGKEMWSSLAVRDVALRFVGGPSTVISGLKVADQPSDFPSSAVLDGKPLSFAGVDALYFASAIIPAPDGAAAPALADVRPLAVGAVPPGPRKKLVDVTSRIVSRELDVTPDQPLTQRFSIFAGPKRPDLLRGFGVPQAAMDDLVYYGWFGWVARPMVAILHAIHAVIGNYGIAILLLTVMVRGAMFPVSRKQALSSQKMQMLQPEMKALAEKYKNDPTKRTRATQELWRKHDYNPMGGCLLVFIQIPIFMGLYRSLATDVELRQAPLFSSAIRWCSNLAAPDMLYDWSRFLPGFLSAPEGWLGPFLNLFPLATIGLFLWQQKLFMPPAVDEQQKMQQQVMNYMMWFMALMFFKVPCGLCLYFIASSLWGIAERLWLPQTLPPAAAEGATVVDASFSAVPKPGANGSAAMSRQRRQLRRKQR